MSGRRCHAAPVIPLFYSCHTSRPGSAPWLLGFLRPCITAAQPTLGPLTRAWVNAVPLLESCFPSPLLLWSETGISIKSPISTSHAVPSPGCHLPLLPSIVTSPLNLPCWSPTWTGSISFAPFVPQLQKLLLPVLNRQAAGRSPSPGPRVLGEPSQFPHGTQWQPNN